VKEGALDAKQEDAFEEVYLRRRGATAAILEAAA
jgi:hypothetical protein